MKKFNFILILLCFSFVFGMTSCQEELLETPDCDVVLKKGSKPADVDQGDLYGDLLEVERDESGVPVLYELSYSVEYQDEVKTGTIDVLNPRLDGNFTLYILDKYLPESLLSSDPPDDEEPLPGTTEVTIEVTDGFISNFDPVVLYDGEGEILPEVANHVFPVEEGRLNLVRSPRTVLESRMTEVIKNFGDGSVADVIRDFCGRLYMVRTQGALDTLGLVDKPIDSPLENLALYWEIMTYGFSRSANVNGLQFLIASDIGNEGFRFKSRLDNSWSEGPKEFGTLNGDQQEQFIANIAAACVAAGSDKSNYLNFDEIAYLNQFMGIPYIPNFDSSKDQLSSVVCVFPVIQQAVRMLDKTDKTEYTKYRYYVDYTNFTYSRQKFIETILDLWTIDSNNNAVDTGVDFDVNSILMGNVSGNIFDGYTYTYTIPGPVLSGAIGFANQADDYVQALQLIHNNEEYLKWQMPTPTWTDASGINRDDSPFLFEAPEETHGNKPISRR